MRFPLKEKLASGQPLIGTWISLGHPDVAEIFSQIGFDWLLFDMEHGPLGLEVVHRLMQAMSTPGAVPLVRVARNDAVLIGQVLDAGAHGVMIPFINNADDARRAVAACRYPPTGTRGVGPRRAAQYGRAFHDYIEIANDGVLVALQVETPQAVDRIEEIAAVPGVDVVIIGAGDLAMAMNCFQSREDGKFQGIFEKVRAACELHGVTPGMAYVGDAEKARAFVRRGFRFIGVGEDTQLLAEAAAALMAKTRSDETEE
jgi:2-keto-3-deoxy-L-rhamnonate aldolase RhmA